VTPEPELERINRLQEEFRILHRHGLHLYPVGSDKLPVGNWANGAVNYVEERATIARATSGRGSIGYRGGRTSAGTGT